MSTEKQGMQFERGEVVGIVASLLVAVLFFVVLKYDLYHTVFEKNPTPVADVGGIVAIDESSSRDELLRTLLGAITNKGEIQKLIMDDTVIGTGAEVVPGSRVTVNYVGMLQNGTQFDNSYSRGEPYSFTVGGGTVIKGWDAGILGMKEGGQRILVVPSDMAYGDREVETIPANSALLFSIELVKVE